jgi:hypothetical protein
MKPLENSSGTLFHLPPEEYIVRHYVLKAVQGFDFQLIASRY